MISFERSQQTSGVFSNKDQIALMMYLFDHNGINGNYLRSFFMLKRR